MFISKLSVLGKMATNMNIKEENDNPWDVTNIAEFLYYCCPECDTKVKTTHAFLEHAINAHQISSLIPLVEDCEPEPLLPLGEDFNMEESETGLTNPEDLVEPVLNLPMPDFDEDLEPDSIKMEDKIELQPLEEEEEGGVHSCDKCDFVAITKQLLKKHKRYKHNANNRCDLCERQFTCKSEVEKHKRGYHYGELAYDCSLCDFKAKSASLIRMHKKKVHKGNKMEICPFCGHDYAQLQEHIEKMHSDETLKYVMCDICGTSHKASGLRQHMKDKHYKYFLCTLCENFFSAKQHLRKHLEEKHEVFCRVHNVYVCHICKAKFDFSKELSNHLSAEHQLKNEFPCSKCDHCFPTKVLLTVHLLECHELNPFKDSEHFTGSVQSIVGETNKHFKCELCDARFSLKRNLTIHVKQKHETSNHVQCEHCEFTTFANHLMKRHILQKHMQATLFPCGRLTNTGDKCTYVTNIKSQLNKHVRHVHEDIKDYKCTECEAAFKKLPLLAHHMLTQHNIVHRY